MHRAVELLAPAGDDAALEAALAAGADAVYLGLDEGFNARARAANFALPRLPEVCAKVHAAGARLYLTLNTLVFEGELPRAEAVIRAAAAAGVDALIVQDPAVALLSRAVCPRLEVHASTQMTICNADAAHFAARLGVTRVVVPRELSVPEIEQFVRESALEVEVFVHGALCVSWSGQCLTSETWGGRSANRGQCAQSCRMPYDLVLDGARRDVGDLRYVLSPKDLAGAALLPELLRLGVHGLKIEGRQKGPEYVRTAVGGYRRWLDACIAGADRRAAEGRLGLDLRDMTSSFSRGFGDGFLRGSDHQTLVEGRFPKHRGHYLGRVRAVVGDEVVVSIDRGGRPRTGGRAAGGRAVGGRDSAPHGQTAAAATPRVDVDVPLPELRPGIGVVFDAGDPEGDEAGGPVFRVEDLDDEVRLGFGQPGPDLRRVRAGQRVWITRDPAAEKRAQAQPRPAGRTALHLLVRGALGQPLQAEGRAGDVVVRAATDTLLQAALGDGLDEALLRDKLAALGGTAFHLGSLDVSGLAPGLHLPVSALKALRRTLVVDLRAELERARRRDLDPRPALPLVRTELRQAVPPPRWTAPTAAQVVPLVRTDAQLDAVLATDLAEVELDWMELTGLGAAVARARAAGRRVVVATLRVSKPGERAFDERLLKLEPDGVLVRHLGALVLFAALPDDRRPLLHGDFALNATNSLSVEQLLAAGLDTWTPAHDLDQAQMRALLAAVDPTRATATLHVRMPTFHTEHCVYAHLLSDGRDFHTCGRPCERHQLALRDHLGFEHPVIVDAGCRNTVFNSRVQTSAALAPDLVRAGVRRFRVEFVRESAAETAAALAAYAELLRGEIAAPELQRLLRAEAHIGVAAHAQETSSPTDP
ncbi:MAG: U32 family peptidase [Planctomycetota bacterium]